MLVDSSVWVRFLRGVPTAEVELLTRAMTQSLAIWLAPPILQEVLQGADRQDRFNRCDRDFDHIARVDRRLDIVAVA